MRFIDLTVEDPQHSPYNTVIENGCGPNFVLNRIDSFETMIKDQGFTFWFRFWLNFCFHPGCGDLNMIEDKCPEIINKANIEIHKEFLESSADDAIKFCLEKAIVQLKNKKGRPLAKSKPIQQHFNRLVQKCCEMAFGAALCEIFYKWLAAPEMEDKSRVYWTIPPQYLQMEFKPGILEKYLVDYWEDNLVSLCGIKLRQIPWVLKQIYGMSFADSDCILPQRKVEEQACPCDIFMEKVVEGLRESRTERRRNTEAVDEKPNLEKIWNIAKTLAKEKEKAHLLQDASISKLKRKAEKNDTGKKSLSYHVCSYCLIAINMYNCINFRKCPSCIQQKWKDARYYCSDVCKMEHWFQVHQQEHVKFEEKQQLFNG